MENGVPNNDRDYHGAHSIATDGFKNFHASHIEIFNAGQPQVGRYPIHWHNADYVGTKDRLLTSFFSFFILPCDMNHIEFLKNKSRVDNREDMTIQVISIH